MTLLEATVEAARDGSKTLVIQSFRTGGYLLEKVASWTVFALASAHKESFPDFYQHLKNGSPQQGKACRIDQVDGDRISSSVDRSIVGCQSHNSSFIFDSKQRDQLAVLKRLRSISLGTDLSPGSSDLVGSFSHDPDRLDSNRKSSRRPKSIPVELKEADITTNNRYIEGKEQDDDDAQFWTEVRRRLSSATESIRYNHTDHQYKLNQEPQQPEMFNKSTVETGFVQDIELFTLNHIDYVFDSFQRMLEAPNMCLQKYSELRQSNRRRTAACMSLKHTLKTLKQDITESFPKTKLVDLEKVEMIDGVRKVTEEYGFIYREYDVVTDDGYILKLERITSAKAPLGNEAHKVIFFQHGVMDSSFTWCCNGPDSSLAYLAADKGYDVFLGNFRGAYNRTKHVDKSKDDASFWDFSINEHGMRDIPAMVKMVRQIKDTEKEKGFCVSYTLLACSHSLGGAATIMHVVHQKQQKKEHFFDGLLLVTPAGILRNLPWFTVIGANIIDKTIVKLTRRLGFNSEKVNRAMTKLVHELKSSLPSVELLVALVILIVLGGNDEKPREGPFSTVEQIVPNFLLSGTSTKVFVHLRQHIQSGHFRAYDYSDGSYHRHYFDFPKDENEKSNQEMYGQEEPPAFTDSYNLIDIPVILVGGTKDRLITSKDVLTHYESMKHHGVDARLEFFPGCGHFDFTCGLSSNALNGLLSLLDELQAQVLAEI